MPTITTVAGNSGAALNVTQFTDNDKRPVVLKSSNYNLDATHNREIHELADGITATLPAPSGSLTHTDDWVVTFKAMGATGATIATGGQSVDGSTSNITLSQNETLTIAMNNDQTAFLKLHPETTVAQVEAALGLGTAAVEDIGTSGATVPLLNGNNTHSGTNTFTGAVVLPANTLMDGYRVARYDTSTSDPVTFPVGTILAVYTDATDFNRTNTNAIKKSSVTAYQYVDSSQAGTALTGTWISRGRCGYSFSSDKHYLFQRTL